MDDRKKILMDNAIGLYKLDVDKSQINQPLYQPGSYHGWVRSQWLRSSAVRASA